MQNESELPACPQRAQTDTDNVFFCGHPQMRVADGLVSPAICQLCSVREWPVTNPRTREQISSRAQSSHSHTVNDPPLVRPPSLVHQGWNLAASLAAFTADGFKTVSAEEYAARLAICDTCDRRSGTRCLQCGCGLALKAKGRAFQCPLKKWPKLTTADRQ